MPPPSGQRLRLGIDLGGTKIEGLLLDDGGRELLRRRVPTPQADCAAIVAAVAGLVCDIEAEAGVRVTVGIGTPGSLSPSSGLLRNSNTVCLNGEPLGRLFEEALGREVRLANDANCFALSEAVDGAGQQAEVVFGVILGTGTGGGVVVGRRVLAGANGIAGEWGHNPLPWADEDDPPQLCYCGRVGCIETYLSGPAMSREHRRRGGEGATAAEIAALAEAGEPIACATVARFKRRLAKGLASVINLLDPDVVVLGGGLSNIDALYQGLPLADHVLSDAVRTPVVPATHGDSGGVRGAAWLW